MTNWMLRGLVFGAAMVVVRLFQGTLISVWQTQAGLIMLGQLERQAAVLAFGDAYRFTFFAALAAIGLSLFLPGRLRSSRPAAEPTMAAGH